MNHGPGIARKTIRELMPSRIREVFEYGQQFADVLPLWFGEPDVVTPEFIRAAAKASLDAGETFYSSNFGIPELRAAIAGYLSGLRRPIDAQRVVVTLSGVNALALAALLVVEPGDRVVVVDPVWPNLTEIPKIPGGQVERFSLEPRAGGWTLDVGRLVERLTPAVRMLWINSPGNPTGFVLDRDSQRALLEHCRRHGIWIVSDDVYDRLCYGTPCAPSFLDLAEDDDRVIGTNSFSKSWAMTGWRLGWMVVPRAAVRDLGTLIEYNISCAPVFMQRAGLAALRDGDAFVTEVAGRYRAARDFVVTELSRLPRIRIAPAPGAMYAFFGVDGENDSLALAKRLVAEARVGLAPGIAFGPAGEGFLRLCFANSQARLAAAVERLDTALRR